MFIHSFHGISKSEMMDSARFFSVFGSFVNFSLIHLLFILLFCFKHKRMKYLTLNSVFYTLGPYHVKSQMPYMAE